jgi:hypothetical protein
LEASVKAKGDERFWTSGNPDQSQRVMSALLERHVEVEWLPDL